MAKPGEPYVTEVSASSSNITATVGDAEVEVTVTDLGDGIYEVEISGEEVTCPGPIRIYHGSTLLEETPVSAVSVGPVIGVPWVMGETSRHRHSRRRLGANPRDRAESAV